MIGPQLASTTAVFTTVNNFFGLDIVTNAIYFINHVKTIRCYCLGVVAAVLLFCHYCPKFKITYSTKLNFTLREKVTDIWKRKNKTKQNTT